MMTFELRGWTFEGCANELVSEYNKRELEALLKHRWCTGDATVWWRVRRDAIADGVEARDLRKCRVTIEVEEKV